MTSTTTLREVAEMAGVSIGTASQALNNRPNVSPETRARVMDAAITLGYHKDIHNNHVENPISVIGMLVKHDYGLEVTVNPFYSHVERGVERECRLRNIGLMYSSIEVDHQNRPVIWPSMISEQRVDGLLLIGTFIEDTVEQVQRRIQNPDQPRIITTVSTQLIVRDTGGPPRQRSIDHITCAPHAQAQEQKEVFA